MIAKVLMSKKINVEAFRSVMKNIWLVHNGTRIEVAGKISFIFSLSQD